MIIADVTDKGAPAALFMVFSNSIVRASLHPDMSPAESIQNANRLITSKSPNAMFVTLVYVLLEPETGQVIYVNAGHNPPLYYNARGNSLQRLSRTGMVLGIDADTPYFQRSMVMAPGDFLFLYTDGLTDSMDNRNQPFGIERLEKIILDNKHQSVDIIVTHIEEALFAHSGNTTPFDDITLLMVKRQ
ncbi:MAG: serine/threonine-protein phosphatase [Anaerolineaceae bacterium]|nr:serine/threonine-protein phosphatase [Anaerolineaceae bacterium]